MKPGKELEELRRKDPKTLLTELDRERKEWSREMVSMKLGKSSKLADLRVRKTRIARILTVLGEKIRSTTPKGASS